MKLKYLPVLLVIALLGATLAQAAPAKGELTFSASLFNPDAGATTWSGTSEYLMPAGKYIVAGPSVSLFDKGATEGGAFGAALEVNLMKGPGLFFGGSLQKPTGDLDDIANWVYGLRAGVKLGKGAWFAKLYLAQMWADMDDSRPAAVAVPVSSDYCEHDHDCRPGSAGASLESVGEEPEGTSFVAGVGIRF